MCGKGVRGACALLWRFNSHSKCELQVTFHKVAEAEVEAASRGASPEEVAHLTGQPENARLVSLLKGGALSVTIKKGTAKQRPGEAARSGQPDLANQVCMLTQDSHGVGVGVGGQGLGEAELHVGVQKSYNSVSGRPYDASNGCVLVRMWHFCGTKVYKSVALKPATCWL